jgi:glycosyltransferase involved in cell wall biosynthesis
LQSSAENMRVLHAITTINRGGAENHLFALVQEQVTRGLLVEVAYLKGDGYWASALENLGVRVYNLGLHRYGDPAPIFRLRDVVRRTSPDVIHAHMPPAELYVRVALIGFRRIPLVITKHNDEPFYRGVGHSLMGGWVASRAARIIAISEAVRRYVIGPSLHCSPEKTTTVHYGLDAEPYEVVTAREAAAVRAQWSVAPSELLIGTLARMVPQKALHILIEAFRIFTLHEQTRAKLVLVGAGPLESDLRQQVERSGIADRVIWAGRRNDVPAVMTAIDIFALSSTYEGFGLVLLEAMAAKKPIVASRVSAIPEVVEDERTGLLVEPGRPELLAEALRILQDPGRREQLGKAGYQRLKTRFGLQQMADRVFEIYEDCV